MANFIGPKDPEKSPEGSINQSKGAYGIYEKEQPGSSSSQKKAQYNEVTEASPLLEDKSKGELICMFWAQISLIPIEVPE